MKKIKIKKKTCYSCLLTIIALILFTILFFIKVNEINNWKIEFPLAIIILNIFLITSLTLKRYQENILKPHTVIVKFAIKNIL